MKSKILFNDREILIEERSRGICLSYSKITDFSTDKPYIRISTTDKKIIYLDTTLTELETQLPPFFFRCNQSSIVNLLLITTYRLNKRKYILSIGLEKEFSVSTQNRKKFKEILFFYKTNNFYSNNCLCCKKAWNP